MQLQDPLYQLSDSYYVQFSCILNCFVLFVLVEISDHTFPVDNPCYVPDNALTDGNIETCQPLDHSVHKVTFLPRVWPVGGTIPETTPVRVLLVTRNLDCAHLFNVQMSAKVGHTCPPHPNRCELLSVQALRSGRNLCDFECDCAETTCEAIILKVAHVEQAGLCDIIITP